MTALEFITDAYRMANIVGETETPSPEQADKALTRLNDMMAELAEDGVDFGFTLKSSTSETFPLPAGAVAGLKAFLCVILCADIAVEVPAIVAIRAQEGRDRMLRNALLSENVTVSMEHMSSGAGARRSGYNILTGE